MKCEEAKSLLTKYLLGDLEESQASEVREHIERCADCGAEALEIQPTLDLLREALADTAPAPAKLEEQKHVRIYAGKPKRMGKVIRIVAGDYPVLRRLAAGLVICCLLGLLAGMLLPAVSFSKKRANIAIARREFAASTIEPLQVVDLEDNQEENMPESKTVDSVEMRAYGGHAAATVAPASSDGSAAMPSVEDAKEGLDKAVVNSVNGAAASDPFAAPEPVGDFSPKPAEFDSVAIVNSPVKRIYGSRSPGARKRALRAYGGGEAADASELLSAPEDSLRQDGEIEAKHDDRQADLAGKPKPEALKVTSAEEQQAAGKEEVYYRNLPTFKAVEKNERDASPKADNLKLADEMPLAVKGFSGTVVDDNKRGEKSKKLQVTPEIKADKDVEIEDAPAAGTIYRKEGGRASGIIRYDDASSMYEIATGAVSVRVPEASVERLVLKEAEAQPEKKVEEKDNITRFKAYGVNPVMNVSENAFSTFSIDVDTASYTLARNYIEGGYLPPAEAVRTEEVVNYFEYDYKAPLQKTFDVYAEAAPSKFGHGQHLLKIGVKGRRLGREEQRRAVLTFLIDSSGSMETEDRIGLVKKSLKMLVDKLNDDDIVNIIQYDTRARLVLSGAKARDHQKIKQAVDGIQCNGSTNLEEGILKAYEAAAKSFVSKGENRVLLLSDGVANLGAMDAEAILELVSNYRKQGIYCSVFGVGMGTYDDQMLETLANKGDGMYRYLDSEEEARRLFVDDLSATLNTIARDVKIQVEFNKQFVKTYRQLGYENRQLTKEQFRDDTVDAGEVGSGQSVTALYEVGMNPAGYKNAEKRLMAEPVATVRVRYRRVDNDAVEEIEIPVTFKDFVNDFDKADVRFRLAACAAEFAEILRGSPYAEGSSFEQVSQVLAPVQLELDLDQRVREFYRLTTSAPGMARGE